MASLQMAWGFLINPRMVGMQSPTSSNNPPSEVYTTSKIYLGCLSDGLVKTKNKTPLRVSSLSLRFIDLRVWKRYCQRISNPSSPIRLPPQLCDMYSDWDVIDSVTAYWLSFPVFLDSTLLHFFAQLHHNLVTQVQHFDIHEPHFWDWLYQLWLKGWAGLR